MRKYFQLIAILSIAFANAQNKTDASGKKQGVWKKVDEKTGKVIYEGEFKDDKPIGYFKHFYPGDTARRAVTYYKEGGKIAYAKMYHQLTGKLMAEGKYISELKDSVWKFYDEAGVIISKDNYSNGKKNGLSIVYLPDGMVAEEKNYKNDLLDGPFKQYYDGKLVKGEGKYVKGNLDGKVSYYFPNGTAAATGVYKNGCKEGVWIMKEKDGKIKEKEVWKNCQPLNKKETEEYFKKNKTENTATQQKQGTAKPKGQSAKSK
ncbi:MAG: hypothetical protein JNM96_07395 [Bacteroidia bacterium]|nr:hypothetical protein [Bacteroidia bacterium]